MADETDNTAASDSKVYIPEEEDNLKKEEQQPASGWTSRIGAPLAVNTHNTPTANPPSKDLYLTLLLIIGARHPFHLDEEYVRKQEQTVEDDDPWNLTVMQLKQLIRSEWREDFGEAPATPDLVRLIYMGTVLDDDRILKDIRLSRDSPNIIHLSIKPVHKSEETVLSKITSRRGSRDEEASGAGCCGRCTIL